MNGTKQPPALTGPDLEEFRAAVAEAARAPLLERIAEMECQLSAVGAGGVDPLRKPAAQPSRECVQQSANVAALQHAATVWVEDDGANDFELSPFFNMPAGEYKLYTHAAALQAAPPAPAGVAVPDPRAPEPFSKDMRALAPLARSLLQFYADCLESDGRPRTADEARELGDALVAAAPAQEHATQLAGQGPTTEELMALSRECQKMPGGRGMHYENYGRAVLARWGAQAPFQQRVQPWMLACFGAEIASDKQERNHRFLEEAAELVQANGCTASEAHQLVDYVFGRPVGEPAQEVGGVMVTLAALCLASDLDMHQAGEVELQRIWGKVEQIRAKQAAKPKHSPLPAAPIQAQEDARDALDHDELREIQRAVEEFADCGETDVDYALLMRAAQAGYLECTHFQVMNESALNLDAARAAQGGAA